MALTDKLTAIADAIRGKTGGTDALTLDQMATEIAGIETGGGLETCTVNYTCDTTTANLFYMVVNDGGNCEAVRQAGLEAGTHTFENVLVSSLFVAQFGSSILTLGVENCTIIADLSGRGYVYNLLASAGKIVSIKLMDD